MYNNSFLSINYQLLFTDLIAVFAASCTDFWPTWTFGLHVLILCVSEGFLSLLLCIHTAGIGTFDLHALILHVSEGVLSQ